MIGTTTLEALARDCSTIEEAAEALSDHCGIEYVSCGDAELAYLNYGETYATTICQEKDGPLFVGSWGDWYEEAEGQQNEDNGTITCGWCSHLTPLDTDDWRDCRCESCGHLVDGGE